MMQFSKIRPQSRKGLQNRVKRPIKDGQKTHSFTHQAKVIVTDGPVKL